MRRTAWLPALVALAVLLTSCSGSSRKSSPGSPSASSSGAASSATATVEALSSAEQMLASNGIATVADESSSTPLVAVTGRALLRFTRFQVQSMAVQASDGGGLPGAVMDASTASSTTGPSASYLLAAWVSKAQTPGAAAVRGLMGSQDWSNAPQVLFPTIALALFAADVLAQVGAAPSTALAQSSVYVPRTAHTSGIVLVASLDSPCSLVSNFMQTVLNSVFAALQAATPTSTGIGGRIGGFFVGIWNTALGLAQHGLQAVITAITEPILSAINLVAGTAVVIAQVASYLNPWSVKVTADPHNVDPGGAGAFDATVDSGPAGVSYPAAVTDCATKLSITLPPLTAANAKASWELSGPVTATGDTSTTIDDQGSSTLSFQAGASESSDCTAPSGTSPTGEGIGKITVTRPGLDSLKQLGEALLTTGLGAAGGIIGHAVLALADPIISSALGQLDSIVQVIGAGTVAINAPTPNPTCTSTPTATPTANASGICGGGTWIQTGEHFTGDGQLGGAGAQITITADGHMNEVYNNVAFNLGSGSVWNGSQTSTITSCKALTPTSGTLATVTKSVSINIRNSDGTTSSLPDLDGTAVDFDWTYVDDILTLTEHGPVETMIATFKKDGS
jgi:hypothetical protein